MHSYVNHYIIHATCGIISYSGLIEYKRSKYTDGDTIELIEESRSTHRLIQELLFSNAVDNFNCYLSDILVEILKVDPRPIYGKKVDLKEIFASENIDELRKNSLEKFIIDLGYQSIDDLSDFLYDSFGIKSLSHWLTKKRLNTIIQTRNLITHNRGIVNKTFLKRTGMKRPIIGEPRKYLLPLTTAKYLSSLVKRIDCEAMTKFNLIGGGQNG